MNKLTVKRLNELVEIKALMRFRFTEIRLFTKTQIDFNILDR